MRTSKIAQETSRLIGALTNSPRRSLRIQPARLEAEDGERAYATPTSSRKRKRSPSEDNEPAPSSSPEHDVAEVAKTPRARRGRRMPAKKIKEEDGSYRFEPPANWERMYSLTQEMRRGVVAPVDHQGCESLADVKDTPVNQRYQTLTALMLSSQTKDPVTAAAIRNLQQNLPGGLTVQSILNVEPERLNDLIGKVGFHNLKTKYIKRTAEILRDEWNGDIPDTIEGMVALPGVGPKMAYLTMSAAWGRDEGIGVDVHVHRITNRFGWHKTNQPEETRAMLEAWLPKDKWHEINHLLVGFGQTICLPVGQKCGVCTLADNGLCPGAVVAKLNKRETVIKLESVPKLETDSPRQSRSVKREVEQVEQEVSIKAEDVPDQFATADIEDFGTLQRIAG